MAKGSALRKPRTTPQVRSSQHSSTNRWAVRRASKARSSRAASFALPTISSSSMSASSPKAASPCGSSPTAAGAPEVKEGDIVDIFVDRMENKEGEAVLSRDKARREEAWTVLEKAFTDQERVMGTIFGRVKGGFTVDLSRRRGLPAGQPGRRPPGARRRPADGPGPAVRRSSRWIAAAATSSCRAAP